jgi:hypothetical protein
VALPFVHRCRRYSGPVAALGLLLCLSGCGLDAYEKKAVAEQERIRRFDEADQVLGNPVDFPAKPVNPVPANFARNENLFFRAPVVISQKPDGFPVDGYLYRYARTGVPTAAGAPPRRPALPPPAIFGPLSPELEKEGGFREMFIGLANDGKVQEFKKRVLTSFQLNTKPAALTVERFGRSPIKYDTWSFTDPAKPSSFYLIYVTQSERYLVALVFHVGREKYKNKAVTDTIRYSLESLVLGSDATLVNQNYRQRPPPKNKPAF